MAGKGTLALLGFILALAFVNAAPPKRPGQGQYKPMNNVHNHMKFNVNKCSEKDHECIVHSQFPGIHITGVSTGNKGSTMRPVTSTYRPAMSTTPKVTSKPPMSGEKDCVEFPIFSPGAPGGTLQKPLCKQHGSKNPGTSQHKPPQMAQAQLPISQYGCTMKSKDPWCKYFVFMYLKDTGRM